MSAKSFIKSNVIETNRIILRPDRSTLRWDSTKKSKEVVVIRQYMASVPAVDTEQYILGNEPFNTLDNYKWCLSVHTDGYLLIGVANITNISEIITYTQQIHVKNGDTIKMNAESAVLNITHKSTRINTYSINLPKSTVLYPWICNVNNNAFNVEICRDACVEMIAQPDGTFKISNQFETPNNAKLQKHLGNTDRHFLQRDIDHKKIQNHGKYLHEQIDSHIDDSKIHFTPDKIDHDRIQNNGRYSHVELDKHVSNTNVHFTERSILHNNIANTGHFTHPQIDTHLRKYDIHFKLEDIDHAKIKGTGKYLHTNIDSHIDNFLIHHELNDLAIDKKNVWSAVKIDGELNKLRASKLGVDGGVLFNNLEVKGDVSASNLCLTDSLVVRGVKRDFKKYIYASWIYNSIEGCIFELPIGGKYNTVSAANTKANPGSSSCIYKIMSSSGKPEVDLSKSTNTGEMIINADKPILVEIDFHINAEVSIECSWNYRLTIGTTHYYYKQHHTPNNTINAAGKIVTTINGLMPIYISAGNGVKNAHLIINVVTLCVKRLF